MIFLTINSEKINYDRPKAIVYRTDGDYQSNVSITLSSDGGRVMSFPAPSDVSTEMSTPIVLHKGYLLARNGVSRNTAFLDYTYDEYSKLHATPSPTELLKHILKRNAVTEAYVLPITQSEAVANPDKCNEFISNNFTGCERVILPPPSIKGVINLKK